VVVFGGDHREVVNGGDHHDVGRDHAVVNAHEDAWIRNCHDHHGHRHREGACDDDVERGRQECCEWMLVGVCNEIR
jgi:hypothetical protein